MEIRLNGERIDVPEGRTLGALLDGLGVKADTKGVAVAVNDAVVPKRKWDATGLEPGDAVEIIHAVQGG